MQLGNKLFSQREQVEEATYAFWMFVQGGSLTLTALHMGRKEDVVRLYFHLAADVCVRDAEYRQQFIVFGRNYPYTTIIEWDESRIGKFKIVIDKVLLHYHLVLFGGAIRGMPETLWLLLVGFTRSEEKSRLLPHIKTAHWTAVCKEGVNFFYCDSCHVPVLFHEVDWERVLCLHPDTFLVVKHDCDFFF